MGDFRTALSYLVNGAFTAVELSALRVSELPELLHAIPSLDLSQFDYIALHVPSMFSSTEEVEITQLLTAIPLNWKLVLHPDTIHAPERWLPFGGQLLLENMDRRKSDGRNTKEMLNWFRILPKAGFCLDLAHAQQWDPTLTEAYLLLKSFSNRLCQVHISQLDSVSHHYPLTESSIRAFSELAWLVRPGVPFIIESRVTRQEMDAEVSSVVKITSSAPAGANQLIPV